ncbi:MAG: RagB/SusD family nutrient uptake outer membrane protein [Candidatus Azobacteroides sp.]|nr:RagB/SusD family nutrient uptake outer membrane protein [Candidatus Azobacteroides sp.]
MKKIIYLTIIIPGISLILSSCDDFLDRKPISELTAEMQGIDPYVKDAPKINNAEQAEAQLSSAYNAFGGEFYQLDVYLNGDAQSDNCYGGELKAQTIQLDEYSLDASNGNVSRDWGYMYRQIGVCNTLIEWVPKVVDAALTETRRTEIVAEASYIRAQCYFNLVRLYGACPLTLKDIPAITNENFDEIYPLLYPPREEVDAIYDQIIKDMETAAAGVADYSSSKFKVTKPVVYSKLAEIYATKGAPGNIDWNKVLEYASKVTTNPNYRMLDNFADVFKVSGGDLANPNSAESIFELECVHNTSTGNWAYYMFIGTDWRKFCTPSIDLVNAFKAEGDVVRLSVSVKFDKATWSDQDWDSNNYPFCYKIQGPDNTNIIMIRLPHVMLLEAEARNELGDLAGAKTIVNKIRARAKLSETTANNQQDMRLAIEKERRLELAFEGYRWFDLKRTGRLYDVMKSCSDKQNKNAYRLADGTRWLWPIPQAELDLNTSLTQNDGY